jgi:SAM-dependent methyltransferase
MHRLAKQRRNSYVCRFDPIHHFFLDRRNRIRRNASVFRARAAPLQPRHRDRERMWRTKPRVLIVAAVVAAALALTAPAHTSQGVHPVSGRKFAPVMGASGAGWLERAEREAEEAPETALDALSIGKGSTVADVGAGSGYFTVRLSARVGAAGRVLATDVQPEMLDLLRTRLAERRIANVTVIQGAIDDPKLPASSIDLALLVDVYHEFSAPQAMLRRIREALKPDGRLVLLEYRKEDPNVPIRFEHKMSVAEAKLEIEDEQFRLVAVDERLPRQHILIFVRRER